MENCNCEVCLVGDLNRVRTELIEIFQTSLLKPVDADIETRLRLKDLIESLKEYGDS